MPVPRLESGPLADFEPAAFQGSQVYRHAERLRLVLRAKLDDDAADTLALPKLNDAGDYIDWYSPIRGDARNWESLTSAERNRVAKQLEVLAAKVTDLAGRLKSDVDTDDRFLAGHLALALRIPGNRHCFLVDDRPVLTFWGFNPADRGDPPPGIIHPEGGSPPSHGGGDSKKASDDRAVAPATPDYPEGAASVARPPSPDRKNEKIRTPGPIGPTDRPVILPVPWWTWLVLLLLVLLLLFLLRGCWYGDTVPIDAGQEPAQPQPIGNAATNPPPPTMAPPAEPPVAPQAPRVVGPVPQAPKEAVLPEPQAPEAVIPESGAILVIPPDAAASGAVDFLNGLWRAETTLLDADTQEPVEFEYAITDGAGELRVTRRDGGHCSAPVTARMDGGDLVLEGPEPIRCKDGAVFGRPRLRCRIGVGGSTECTGQNPNDSRFKVQLRRAGTPTSVRATTAPTGRPGPNLVARRSPTKRGAF